VKPTINSSFIFIFFLKGIKLKVKLANLKFSKIGDGPEFLLFGGFSNRGKGLDTLDIKHRHPISKRKTFGKTTILATRKIQEVPSSNPRFGGI